MNINSINVFCIFENSMNNSNKGGVIYFLQA
jgi:hypothetical protein